MNRSLGLGFVWAMTADLPAADLALLDLLTRLDAAGYDFITPTPETHRRVLARRRGQPAQDLREVLGWSLPFADGALPSGILEALQAGGALEACGELRRCKLRVSRVRGRLFLHSAFPTDAPDAVFLGPDSYRFADLIARELPPDARGLVVDVGTGAGVGAITAALTSGGVRVIGADVNPHGLRLARIAARHAGVEVDLRRADGLEGLPDGLTAVVANPPYIAEDGKTYSDGGSLHGGRVSVDWAQAALGKLAPGGRLILYTGSAIVDGGRDELKAALQSAAQAHGAVFRYREIDPDVFGEELERDAYRDVERIAVVACVITMPG